MEREGTSYDCRFRGCCVEAGEWADFPSVTFGALNEDGLLRQFQGGSRTAHKDEHVCSRGGFIECKAAWELISRSRRLSSNHFRPV